MLLLVVALLACTAGGDRTDSAAGSSAASPPSSAQVAIDTTVARTDTIVTPSSRAPAAAVVQPTTRTERRPPAPASDTVRRDTARHATTGPTSADVDREIARAVAAWSRIRTLRATFEQQVTNPLTGSQVTAKGSLQQQRPTRLAILFSDPAGDRIVSDGQYVWVYLQSATPGQVVRMKVSDVGAGNTDLIGQFLNTPRSAYDATDAGADNVGGRPARAIVLVAKPGQALPFIRAKVWVDAADALIRQFEAVDANGISRHVRILTLSPNATVDASAFHFDVPAGVRVIDR